jgi:hypothetical protein
MRRRNPPSRRPRRRGGPPPWPNAALLAELRRYLVEARGAPDASFEEMQALRRAGAWAGGVDPTWLSDVEVVRRLLGVTLHPPRLRLDRW